MGGIFPKTAIARLARRLQVTGGGIFGNRAAKTAKTMRYSG
jgi:hypothetical protein